MKTSKTVLLAVAAFGISTLIVTAQPDQNSGPGGNRRQHQGQGGEQGAPGQPSQGGPGGGPGGGQRMAGGPLMAALDANHDGVIDEKEIANASAALKALDKNGDGKLTQEELRPQRPQGGQGGSGSQGGEQGGQGRQRAPRGPGGPGGAGGNQQ
jgi:hypothetical protein